MSTVEIERVKQALNETAPAIRAVLWKWDTPMTIEDYQFVSTLMTGAGCAIYGIDPEQYEEYKFFGDFCQAKVAQLFQERWSKA